MNLKEIEKEYNRTTRGNFANNFDYIPELVNELREAREIIHSIENAILHDDYICSEEFEKKVMAFTARVKDK